jgi:hypothetical protein
MGSGGVTSLVAKLVLNTQEWSTNISSASNDLKKIQQSVSNASDFISNLGGSLVSGATKFAGWAGAGLAAKEGLEKFMRAGQTTGDFLDRETAKWTGLFDDFFQALNNGDVSGFLHMMDKVSEAIDEAHRAMDSFADADASVQALKSHFQLEQKKLLTEIKRNKDNPALVEENKKKLQQLEANYARRLSTLAMLKEDVVNADINEIISTPLRSGLRALGGRFTTGWLQNRLPTASIQSMHSIMDLEGIDLYPQVIASAKEIAEKLKGLATGGRATKMFQAVALDEANAFQDKYGVSLLDVLRWDEVTDKDRERIRQGVKSFYDILGSVYEFKERNTEVFNIGAGGSGKGGAGSSAVNYLQGSLGWYDQQISEKRKELLATTDKAVIADITRVIEQLENARKRLRIEALFGAEPTATALGATFKPINGVTKIDPYKLKPVKIFEPEQKNVIEDVRVGLGGVADMLGIIAGATDDGASAWLNYASKVINAISSMLPALQALGIGNATSQSAAAGPFGWVQIPVAVAAVASAFMSAPKFANGGIVPGTSYSGDKVMSYLNSGEMVLNAGQQARLFAILNGASSAGGGAVEFEIRGDKLVGVLNNYNRRRAKVV